MLEDDVHVVLCRLQTLGVVENRFELGVEQVRTITPQEVVPDHQILAGILAIRNRNTGHIGSLGLDRLSGGHQLSPGLGRRYANFGEHVLAVEQELDVAAVGQAVSLALELGCAQKRRRIAVQVEFLGSQICVQRHQVGLDHRRNPHVHDGREIEVGRRGDHFGGELFAHRTEGYVNVGHLDAGGFFKRLGALGMRRKLRRTHRHHLDLLSGVRFAWRQTRHGLGQGCARKHQRRSGSQRCLKKFTSVECHVGPLSYMAGRVLSVGWRRHGADYVRRGFGWCSQIVDGMKVGSTSTGWSLYHPLRCSAMRIVAPLGFRSACGEYYEQDGARVNPRHLVWWKRAAAGSRCIRPAPLPTKACNLSTQ